MLQTTAETRVGQGLTFVRLSLLWDLRSRNAHCSIVVKFSFFFLKTLNPEYIGQVESFQVARKTKQVLAVHYCLSWKVSVANFRYIDEIWTVKTKEQPTDCYSCNTRFSGCLLWC